MLKAEHIIPGIETITETVTDKAELNKIIDKIQDLIQDIEDASHEVGWNSAIIQEAQFGQAAKNRARAERQQYLKTKDKCIEQVTDLLNKLSYN